LSILIAESRICAAFTLPQHPARFLTRSKQLPPGIFKLYLTTPSTRSAKRLPSTKPEGPGPLLDVIPQEFQTLFSIALDSTKPREQPSEDSEVASMKDGHDPFRFEWGTWVDDDILRELMEKLDQVQLKTADVYSTILQQYGGLKSENENCLPDAVRLRIAGGTQWDCLLHVLPPGTDWRGQWPTGSWAIVKPLMGITEVSMLRSPDRRTGEYKKATTKQLRGGSDGSLGGGAATLGDKCIKYIGGPLRSYEGKSGSTVVLEMVIRPPINTDIDMTGTGEMEVGNIDEILTIVGKETETESEIESVNQPISENTDERLIETRSVANSLGMTFDKVGGLDSQLDSIARRVLASRANPAAAKRLGINHVRGILLSGPPGCGKTLLARELSKLLGAREPQIVNGPEILDKFIGEAEKKVRDLFAPAEKEYAQVGDKSALHMIILDEMDAIARKRGSASSDTTGVRDSVVNQLLAKMDGVKESNNVLVVGLTNRPELIDPALLRPGRLEVQLRVELPDAEGRRDILRIHTRSMRNAGGISQPAIDWIEDVQSEQGLPVLLEHYTGAEIAGLVRSAASFALARVIEGNDYDEEDGMVNVNDLKQALLEVRPALGKQDEVLRQRFPFGISRCSLSMKRVVRDLERFVAAPPSYTVQDSIKPVPPARLQSLLLVGAGGNGGAGATALAAWAANQASTNGTADYVRFLTALDLISGADGKVGGGGEEARAAALVDKFSEAREMSNSLLVLDDVDQLCAGTGPGGYSTVMIATLRALLRTPPASSAVAKAGGHSDDIQRRGQKKAKSINIIATTSRADAACYVLHELFDETTVIPLLSDSDSVTKLLNDSLIWSDEGATKDMAELIVKRLGSVGCKTAIRLAERAYVAGERMEGIDKNKARLTALSEILEDLDEDRLVINNACELIS